MKLMSSVELKAAEYPIYKIFSDEYAFTIPNVQRPYSWTVENAEVLLDDLLDFIETYKISTIEQMNPYFLGSIVLIKEKGPESQVLDGQQRLTTLTILLAVLREWLPANISEELKGFLYEKGNSLRGTSDRYRLTLRDRDAEFFREYIQKDDGIKKLIAGIVPENDSQEAILKNALMYYKRIEKLTEAERIDLARFIVTKCFLVVVSTPDFDSAYRIFSVLNDRGLDLSHADILKAEIIGKIPKHLQDTYNQKWEDAEEYLGRDEFNELFGHIRMIYRKQKLRTTIIKEFREYVPYSSNPVDFIERRLVPFSNAFKEIINASYEGSKITDEINNLFTWLQKIDNRDWLPAAILYLSKHRNDPDQLLKFFTDLERLAMGMMILRYNINERIERYRLLLTEIENDNDLFTKTSSLQLTDDEKNRIINQLNGDIYLIKKIRLPILLRLDSVLSDGQASYNYKTITVEHVLPQNPKEDSQWIKWFPSQEERQYYVHKLANLVLLSRQKNSQANNYEFEVKKQKYFSTSSGVSSFVLTTQVLQEKEWTPELLKKRQKKLLDTLIKTWRLK
jgi:hypothetical protein